MPSLPPSLSLLLYVLTSEVLANQIRKSPAIEGFLLPGTGGLPFKILQYANDATNFVKNERSLWHLLETVKKYERGSGGLVSLEELTTSVKSLLLNKSSGPDDFTLEFYLCFWIILGPLLCHLPV